MPQMVDNRYIVGEQLGIGGMGAVYRGRDTRLQRDVAIKRLNIMGTQNQVEQFMKRFEREAIAMAQLLHPNIVGVLDFGRDEDGIFLILQYMPGGSLKDRMTTPFAPQAAGALLAPIADALHYVHDQGMIHRDVKPTNILFDARGNPMLADFGIVKLVEDSPGATLTGTGTAIGTPTYMAPELIGGEFDHRVDQYALGIIFYEMVTGKPPFKGRTPLEAMMAHKTESLPDPRILRPDLPPDACTLITRVLAKNPDQRYKDTGQFSTALRSLGHSAPVEISQSKPLVVPSTAQVSINVPPQPGITIDEVETQGVRTPSQGMAVSPPQIHWNEAPSINSSAQSQQPAAAPRKKKLPAWVWIAGGFGLLFIAALVLAGVLLIKNGGLFTPKATEAPTRAAYQPQTTDQPTEISPEKATEIPTLQPTQLPSAAEILDPAAVAADLPRRETLYFAGIQFGPVLGSNPYSSNNNNGMVVSPGDLARVLVFETPYVYNPIDGKQYPLLAEGDYKWSADLTKITFDIKATARWSDGTPVTADDVAYTWASHVKYQTQAGIAYQDFIESIEAVGPQTVVVLAKVDNQGNPVNPLQMKAYLSSQYVIQKAWTQTMEARTGGNAYAFNYDPAEDVVGSGPYMKFFIDDSKVVLIRDEKYWGQDASMWGKLPPPRFIAHTIYADNDAGLTALIANEVDVSQQFIPNVQDLWLVDHLPISTYTEQAPYGLTGSLPTAYFNLKSFGLNNVAVRKAIAMAVDYDTIIANAMTNQSPTFTQVPRSLMNPSPGEQILYDHAAVADLQWAGNDIDGANQLLDDAGIVDTNGDGYREINGKKLSYNAVCPNGWDDWQAAMELVAAAGARIGIEITTFFPEWSDYQNVFTNGSQTEYDIFMAWTNGAGPTEPWSRLRQLMSSEFAGITGNWNGNWGGYVNARADQIIAEIPQTTDNAKIIDLYTEAINIYLTDVPSFTLMYRPDFFHTVNESVWTHYPKASDDTLIPPTNLISGYGIAGLYNIVLLHPSP